MAPIFYCKCFNCLCTATVLLTDQDKTEDTALIVTPSDDKNKRTTFVEDVVTTFSNKTVFRVNSESEDTVDVTNSDISTSSSYMERNQHKLESLFSLLIIILIIICRSTFQTPSILFRD